MQAAWTIANAGDCGGFGAQDGLAERAGKAAGVQSLLPLLICPAAFRTCKHENAISGRAGLRETGEKRWRARELIEQQLERCVGLQRGCETNCGLDGGEVDAAGLLAGLERDLLPACAALLRSLKEASVGAGRFERLDDGNAQLGRLFDEPLEALELDERGGQG